MAYYEIPRDPELTLETLRTILRDKIEKGIGLISRDCLTYTDGGAVSVQLRLTQLPESTLLRSQIAIGSMSFFLRLCLVLFPPAMVLYLLLLPLRARHGLFGSVERAISEALPGAVRLPPGEGTRRATPGRYRFHGFLKFLGGLILTSVGIFLSRFWYNIPGLAPLQLVAAAVPAGLGLALVSAGFLNMALSLLEPRKFAGAVLVCAVLSPFLFRAFWTYDEQRWWKGVETNSGDLYEYRMLPRGIWRADYCLRLTQWRSDQRIKEKLTDSFIKSDLETVVNVIDEFHANSPAYQPAYRLAKSTLATWDHP